MSDWGTAPDGSPRQTRIVVIVFVAAFVVMLCALAKKHQHDDDVPWPPRSPASPAATR